MGNLINNSEKWFLTQRRNPAAKINVFCFHHAGGAASFYKNWSAALSSQVQLISVQMPGRESRYGEAFAESLEAMVSEMLQYKAVFADKPFAMFGHSLGALFAFELARQLANHAGLAPRFVVASGHGAPRRGPPEELLHHLPDDRFIAKMREKYGGISDEVMNSPELLEFLLPRFRADIRIAEQHASREGAPVRFPVVVLHGRGDHSVSTDELLGWQKETHARVRIHEFDGDHFFIESSESQVIGMLNKLLADQLWGMAA